MENFKEILFDKDIYEINLLPQHATFKRYFDISDYTDEKTNETIINENWKYIYNEDYASLGEALQKDFSISKLPSLEVPLSNEIQGLGQLQYVNAQYPFDGLNDGELGGVINVKNPNILALRDITIFLEEDTRYIINFKGFETALFLYVNGKFVGYSENLYLDSEFDITDFLVDGTNRIAALVFKYSTASWFLDQDFWRFSGFFRDITLSKVHEKHISDIEVRTEARTLDSTGYVDVKITGNIDDCDKYIYLFDSKDKKVFETKTKDTSIRFIVNKAEFWSAESPNLYRLKVECFDGENQVDLIQTYVGIKEVKISNGILYFNGRRLEINGINRHERDMERGRNVTKADMEFDVKFMKSNNINAVRTCHYPNNTYWYDLCDKYGVYVLDEACLETHGSFAHPEGYKFTNHLPGNHSEFQNYINQKILRMFERDKNHPSIYMYSLGNEAGYGEVFKEAYKALKNRRENVLIQYEGVSYNMKYWGISDVYSFMYIKPDDIRKNLRNATNKPLILCEYAHAMGNSNGNLLDYMSLKDEFENYQGGFIWDYIDQGLLVDDGEGHKKLIFGGDSLEKPNDRNFCCNGVINADRKEVLKSSKIIAIKNAYSPIQVKFSNKGDYFDIKNRNLFVTANNTVEFRVLINGNLAHLHTYKIDLMPGSFTKIPVNPALIYGKNDDVTYQLIVYDKEETKNKGDRPILSKFEFLYQRCNNQILVKKGTLKVIKGNWNIGVSGEGFSYLFALGKNNMEPQGLISIKINDEEYLSGGTVPSLFRPNTDNDFGNGFAILNAALLPASMYQFVNDKDIKVKEGDNQVDITYIYKFDPRKGENMTVNYHVYCDGQIKVDVKLTRLPFVEQLGQVGLKFRIRKDFNRFQYFGKGPFENYTDRRGGILSDIYHSTSENEYVNYVRPQECGNHTRTRWVEIQGTKSKLNFSCLDSYLSFKYLPFSEFEIENANHVYELPKSTQNYLYILGFTRGVGGDDAWGAPVHSEYEIKADKEYKYSFLIYPVLTK